MFKDNAVNVGIIGCGSITMQRHAPEYHANVNARVSGFYDSRPERAEEMVRSYGGKVYDSYEAMLADQCIDAVSVCTSNAYHAPITIAALKAGKHVLCEKPMAVSIEDAVQMTETASETGKYLMVGHNQRFAAAHIKAEKILSSGELGRILTFSTSFSHKGSEMWGIEKGTHSWFFNKKEAIFGVLGDLAIHKVDLLRWLTKDEINEVAAFSATLDKSDSNGNLIGVEDNVICLLKTAGGIMGTMSVSWTNYGEEDNSTILYCSKGVLKIYHQAEFPLEIIKKDGEKAYFKIGAIQTNTNQTNSGVIDAFIESIVKGIPPKLSGQEALEAMKVISACIESSDFGRTVKIKYI